MGWVVNTTPRPLYPQGQSGRVRKISPHRVFFSSFFVRILCFIVLVLDFSIFFLYSTSWLLDCKGCFPPSPPEDAAYWPDTQRTPLSKEGTNGIWPAISKFFEESRVLLHAPKLGHGTDYFTSPPKEGMLWIFFPAGKIRRLRPGTNPRSWDRDSIPRPSSP
jgi:hypothetical protein